MACENWIEKLDAYLDGELPESEQRAVYKHLQECSSCPLEALNRVQQKRAIREAGMKFDLDASFRRSLQNRIEASGSAPRRRFSPALLVTTLAAAVAAEVFFGLAIQRQRGGGERQLASELADLHIAALASANPVDVVSSDRHTVKPWFQGKIPFTFNLPELQDSPFVLAGGRVSYLHQSPGAELLFRLRQHQISVFIFQERAVGEVHSLAQSDKWSTFKLRSWSSNGLCYFVMGDASEEDIDRLSELISKAG